MFLCIAAKPSFACLKVTSLFERKNWNVLKQCNDGFKAITNCEKLRSRPSLDEEAKTTIIGSSGTELAYSFIHYDKRIIATVACWRTVPCLSIRKDFENNINRLKTKNYLYIQAPLDCLEELMLKGIGRLRRWKLLQFWLHSFCVDNHGSCIFLCGQLWILYIFICFLVGNHGYFEYFRCEHIQHRWKSLSRIICISDVRTTSIGDDEQVFFVLIFWKRAACKSTF